MLRKICVSMTQISHSELTGEHPFRYGKKMHISSKELRLTQGGWISSVFIFLVLIAKEKSTQSKSDF